MGKNVLIVEDESIVAMELEEQLERLGCQVVGPAATAKAALRLCETGAPDLALMDIRIQGAQDGIEAAQMLRQRYNMPVIYLTALADEITMRRAKLTGPDGYLLKPVRADELKAAVELALYKSEAERALKRQRAEFAALLTHDVQSPLQVVSGCAELLAAELEGSGSAHASELLSRILNSLSYTMKLVADYLTLISLDADGLNIDRAEISVNATLRRVMDRYQSEAGQRGLLIEGQLAKDLPVVLADALMLERVFVNLLFNALKFTPAGGRIVLLSQARADEVVAVVLDSGPGIPADELANIFDKGWRGASSSDVEGRGMGLHIVKTLVEALGGRIEVESQPGIGTRFSVYLPIASLDSAERQRTSS